MGSGASRPRQIGSNESLRRFVSPETLSEGHPFWNSFLSFELRTPRTREEWKVLDEASEELVSLLMPNNLKSGNFGTLVDIFLSRQGELKASVESESSMFVWQTYNALLVLKVCTKIMIERLKEDEVYNQFSALPSSSRTDNDPNNVISSLNPETRYDALFQALLNIVATLPNTNLTYGLHCETVSMLIILLSSPLFSQKPAAQLRAFNNLYTSEMANKVTKVLVENFVSGVDAPQSYMNDEGGSLVLGIASGVWNILTLGYNSVASTDDITAPSRKPLADMSMLLILLLANHCTDCQVDNTIRRNLFNCSSTTMTSPEVEASQTNPNEETFQTDFTKLFAKICQTLHTDESTLFLYLLLHQNKSFKSHVLASSEIENVVLPILKTLYHAPDSSNHHIYMSLIVLLILSEDDLFNTSVHDIMVKNIEWYTERSLQEISLGGLLILVVIRTIQYNMLKMRDKYLHTNCLAALANMSGQFRNLHPYVSQRIVSMFETLAKKYVRMANNLKGADSEGIDEDSLLGEALADKMVLEEVLRMILEIINCCMVSQIKNNSNLIYTILYKKQLFEPFMSHPTFQDLTQNLQIITSFFNSKLEQIQDKKERTLAVNEVQEIINQTAMQFPREKLTKFPDLKFKYVEEDQPEDFFLPYVWTLVSKRIYFNPSRVKLIEQA